MNEPGNLEIMRKSPFNLEELKVRWKKAALENCPGVPCVTTTVPGAPTGVSATAGNASASVAFTAPASNGGSVITGYTVTSSPGGITATGATLTINVTGLTNGTAYTFTVVATNTVGNSVASTASTAVTPVAPSTVPGAPTGVSAIAGNASASVAFTAPASNGGSVITGYTVTSSPGGITVTGATSPINVTGLTNGTAYTFTVVATNTVGNSVASTASTAVTPFNPCGSITTVLDGDGNSYQTVGIGTQCWTRTNLKTTKYNDGVTSIPLDASVGSGTWSTQTTGVYTIYDNESSTGSNATNYGFLYNWYAAAGIITNSGSPTKNICPTFWHVPTETELAHLENYLGGISVAGGKMKSTDTQPTTGGWNIPNTGATNESGFSALPSGFRSDLTGSFDNIGNRTAFWSATDFNSNLAWTRLLTHSGNFVSNNVSNKLMGLSIRCLKD
jgi:uncharacterized protein (TIGR02145 family)